MLSDEEDKIVLVVKSMLSLLLRKFFNFSEVYAEWLPNNFKNLNDSSIDILKNLNPEEFEHVRYATVVAINSNEERNTFFRNMTVITKSLSRPKRNILEKSVVH